MNWLSRKRFNGRHRAALGIEPLPAVVLETMEQALAPLAPLPAPEPAPAPHSPTVLSTIPSSPTAHLGFSAKAVLRMDDEEQRIVAEMEEKARVHVAAMAELATELEGVRRTRAFHLLAPQYLLPGTEAPEAEAVRAAPVKRPAKAKEVEDGQL